MSQYFSPQPPSLPVHRPKSARRAAVLMWVLAGFAALLAAGLLIVGVMVDQVIESDPDLRRDLEDGAITTGLLRVTLFVMSAIGLGFGVGTSILAIFVHKGSVGACI